MVYLLVAVTVLLFSGIMAVVLNQTVNRYKPMKKQAASGRGYSPAPFQPATDHRHS